MRISDWGSDVCSSDLPQTNEPTRRRRYNRPPRSEKQMSKELLLVVEAVDNEKGVPESVILEAIEAALAPAAKKRYLEQDVVTGVEINQDSKRVGMRKRVAVRVDIGGRQKKKRKKKKEARKKN